MKISTFSIVVGNEACDAHCQFCISHSTGFDAVKDRTDDIHWQGFGRAIALAQNARTNTVLFTGKGEPTLFPDEITTYLGALYDAGKSTSGPLRIPAFPTVELQTNAIRIAQCIDSDSPKMVELKNALFQWRNMGLTTIAISTVGINPEHNKQTYLHHRDIEYPDLARTVDFLHGLGFQVRICVMMQKGMVDSPETLEPVINWCRDHKVEQLTVRPIRKPENKLPVLQNDADRFVMNHGLTRDDEERINNWIVRRGDHIYTFTAGEHDFKVFDLNGQNICLADCLTISTQPDTIRTLILYPKSGRIAYHWQYDSAVL